MTTDPYVWLKACITCITLVLLFQVHVMSKGDRSMFVIATYALTYVLVFTQILQVQQPVLTVCAALPLMIIVLGALIVGVLGSIIALLKKVILASNTG